VREALKRPSRVGIDLLVLLVVGGAVGAIGTVWKQVAAPFAERVEISLSYWALPKYTMFSLARGGWRGVWASLGLR